MIKVSFVILHYLTVEDTIECVDSIIKTINYNYYNIVIVDNGSNNRSGEILQNLYSANSKVYYIHSEKNLGFAKGNNLGYSFAKNELNTDFIIMINNDTVINQINFVDIIINKHKKHKFDLLGPDIISLIDKGHQNPHQISPGVPSKSKFRKTIFKYNVFLTLNWLGLDMILKVLHNKLITKKTAKSYKTPNYLEEQIGVKLHGSCLIFSPSFINRFKGLYDGTFLYMEEDILFYIATKEKLKILYSPDLKILHKEDSATNELFNNNNTKKRRFIYKNIKKSLKEFYKILDNDLVYKSNIEEEKE